MMSETKPKLARSRQYEYVHKDHVVLLRPKFPNSHLTITSLSQLLQHREVILGGMQRDGQNYLNCRQSSAYKAGFELSCIEIRNPSNDTISFEAAVKLLSSSR